MPCLLILKYRIANNVLQEDDTMTISNHQASAPMLGYLYQVRCALDLLLSDANEQSGICIEKFDDIAFSNDGEILSALIQTKHHINGNGDLSDKSVDLWRTIKAWIDYVSTNGLENVKFVIVTTASAPDYSAASLLRSRKRDVGSAFELLKRASELSDNKTNAIYYASFNQMRAETMHKLLECVTIIDNSDNILDIVKRIRRHIRYSTRPEFEDRVFERVEGWWFKKTIEALSSIVPVFISQSEVRLKICDIASEYFPDNLPIDANLPECANTENFVRNERVFCEQLRLIAVKEKRISNATHDYYRAFIQRNKWIQDDLLNIEELDNFECKLIDEWKHLFAQMDDDLNTDSNEQEKQVAGRELYNQIEHTDIKIRPQCVDPFVTRGSYHILADNLRVGWHVDFAQRLATFAKGGDCT